MTLIVAIADARDALVYETISLRDVVDTVQTFAAYRVEFRTRDQQRVPGRNPRDVAGLSLTSRVPRDSAWERNHDWIMIMPGN